MKRLLALLLCAVMLFSVLGAEAWAADGDTLTSRNVIGVVQGYDPKLRDRYIVIGARLDNLGGNHLMIDGQPAEQI